MNSNPKNTYYPLAGKRYVFYQSLQSENNPKAQALYNNALKDFQLGTKGKADTYLGNTESSLMNQSLIILQNMINNEKSKEEAFLNNLLSRKDIPPKLQQEIRQLSLEPFDYNKFIKIINEYFLGIKNFERLKKEEIKRLKNIQVKQKQAKGEELNKREESLLENMSSLNELRKTSRIISLKELVRNSELINKIIEITTEKLNKNKGVVINALIGRNHYAISVIFSYLFLSILQEEYSSKISKQQDSIVKILEKEILNYKSTNKNTKINRAIEQFDIALENFNNKEGLKNLEELAKRLFTDDYFKIIRDIEKREAELAKYSSEYLNKIRRKPKEKLTKKEEKDLNNASKIRQELNKLKNRKLEANLKVKNSGDPWFDLEGLGTLIQLLTPKVLSSLGHGSNKDDHITTFLHIPLPNVEDLNEETLNRLNEELTNYTNFILNQGKESSMDSESFKNREEELQRATQDITNLYNQLDFDGSIMQEIQDSFILHGTDKRYNLLENDSFTAGVLGKSKAKEMNTRNAADIVSAIENISYMAELGGITSIDTDWLINAVMNTGSGLVAENLKDPLQNLLSSLAGAIMFDDAALIMSEINKELERSIHFNHTSVKQIHFYNLNGLFFPLSYILSQTLADLTKVSADLIGSIKDHGNKVIITNNYQTKEFTDKITKNDWITEGQAAINASYIKMTFMAGFLDILNNIK